METKPNLTHLDRRGQARMVDIAGKDPTRRTARAEAVIEVGPDIARQLAETGAVTKGPVFETARMAGIMAAKRTSDLIPLCHPLSLEVIELECALDDDRVVITADVRCTARTGVEMEALTAAAVAALTVYDMCKSASKGMVIRSVRLLEKTGGRSGPWRAGSPGARP